MPEMFALAYNSRIPPSGRAGSSDQTPYRTMTSFNPYQQWLGIPDATTTPNHYRLLGLRLFEDSPAVISSAATRLASIVVGQLSTPHSGEAQRILREIEAARGCLLKPGSKADYDDALRQQLSRAPLNPLAMATVADATAPLPSTPAMVWRASTSAAPLPPTGGPLPPLPAGTTPSIPSGSNVLVPRLVAKESVAPLPVPSNPVGASSYSAAEAPILPPPAYGSSAPASYPPAVAPAAFAAASLPVAPPPLPSVSIPPPMAIPVAPGATPVAMPLYDAAPIYAAPVAIPIAPPAVATRQAQSIAEEAPLVVPRRQVSWRRPQTYTPGTLLAVGTGVLVVLAILVVIANRPDAKVATSDPNRSTSGPAPAAAFKASASEEARPPHQQPSSRRPTQEQPARPTETPDKNVATNNSPPLPAPMPSAAAPTLAAVPAVADAKKDEAVTKALNSARLALSRGDVSKARSFVETARKEDARNRIAEIERVATLASYMEEFWKAVREGIKGYEAGGALPVKDTFVGVVEVQKDAIILRERGQNKTYAINSLRRDVAYAFADGWLKKDAASSKIILGTYQAMHPRGDRDEARRLWQAAVDAGTASAADLIPELEVPLPAGEPAFAEAAMQPESDGLFKPPGGSQQSEARAEVKKIFETEYATATDSASKLALVAQLMERAEQPSDAPALRYILFSEAVRLAAEASDFEAMNIALEKLGERFSVDVMALKADAYFEAAKTAEGQEANQALVTAALLACDEAVNSDKIDAALKIAGVASGAARKSGDSDLQKQCAARLKEVRDLKK